MNKDNDLLADMPISSAFFRLAIPAEMFIGRIPSVGKQALAGDSGYFSLCGTGKYGRSSQGIYFYRQSVFCKWDMSRGLTSHLFYFCKRIRIKIKRLLIINVDGYGAFFDAVKQVTIWERNDSKQHRKRRKKYGI